MVSHNVVVKVFESRFRAYDIVVLVGLVVLDDLLKVEGVSGCEEHVLDCIFVGLLGLALLVGLAIVAPVVVVGIGVLILIFRTRIPISIAEILVLRLLFLVNGDLDVWVGDLSGAGRTYNDLVDNTCVDLLKKFNVFVDVNGGGPLVSDAENEFHEQVLVHHI